MTNAHAKGQFRQRLSKIDYIIFLSYHIFDMRNRTSPKREVFIPPKRGESFGDIFKLLR